MRTPTLTLWPVEAADSNWAGHVMDVILHVGAHRTGTKTFQDYMRRHVAPLSVEEMDETSDTISKFQLI